MKAIFVHDHRFIKLKSGEVFSKDQFPSSIWQRYLKFFDELIVVGRSLPDCDISIETLNLSSRENVSFVLAPDLAHPMGIARYGKKAVNILKRLIQDVDAVIIRSSFLGQFAASVASRLARPWALEIVGCAWDALWNYGSVTGRICAPFFWLAQRRLAKKAQYAIYVTQHFLQKRYPCYGLTAAASNVDICKSDLTVMEKRLQRVHKPAKPFVFGLIGSLNTKYKGIQTAFSAFNKVKEKLPEFEFRILGGGDYSYWRKLASSNGLTANVRFEGSLPSGDQVLNWLDNIDVYLQPSFQEGLPRALIEAMSRACPAIASTAGGIPELLGPEVLHKPGNKKHLGEIILKSLSSEWRTDQAQKNFKTSGRYSREILDAERDKFWRSFADFARKRNILGEY